ncbi:MAG: hypothetical protein V3V45_07815 [Candidatus Brocadiales bacterium]
MTIDRKATIKLFCAAIALAFLALPLLPLNQTGAQHIDVFNMPREKAAENKPQDVPEIVEVEVTDTFTYKVMVEKGRLDEGNIFARELDIKALAVEEKAPYHWGQVEYYDRRNIVQRVERSTDFLNCARVRSGVLYFLPNGKKMVDWGRWSMWDCRTSNTP